MFIFTESRVYSRNTSKPIPTDYNHIRGGGYEIQSASMVVCYMGLVAAAHYALFCVSPVLTAEPMTIMPGYLCAGGRFSARHFSSHAR